MRTSTRPRLRPYLYPRMGRTDVDTGVALALALIAGILSTASG